MHTEDYYILNTDWMIFVSSEAKSLSQVQKDLILAFRSLKRLHRFPCGFFDEHRIMTLVKNKCQIYGGII